MKSKIEKKKSVKENRKKTHIHEFLIIFKKIFINFFYFIGIFDLHTDSVLMHEIYKFFAVN